MKRTYLRNFKQIYKNPDTKEEKEYFYQVAIVKDTDDYSYRILNVTEGTLWKDQHFYTMNDALDFINAHPHAIKEKAKEVPLRQLIDFK
jgi:hypothetical protein